MNRTDSAALRRGYARHHAVALREDHRAGCFGGGGMLANALNKNAALKMRHDDCKSHSQNHAARSGR